MNDLMNEYNKALQEKDIAFTNFNNAEEDFIDVAIYEYNAAVLRITALKNVIRKEMN